MPVRWDPGGVLVLSFYCQSPARGLEPPLPIRSTNQLLTTACRDGCLEENLLALLIPKAMIGHADDDVRLIRRLRRRLAHQRLQTVGCHAELALDLVEDAEVVVVDHPVDIALVAKLGGLGQQHDAENRGEHESGNKHPDRSAAV